MSLVTNLFAGKSESAAASPELEKAFFDCLRMKNGVYKTTYPHRLDDLSAWAAGYLPSCRPLKVLDVGVSSGVSTLEWVEALEQAQIDCHMTGIDLAIRGLVISFGERLHAVLDDSRWPLLFEINGKWVSNPPRKRHLMRYFVPLVLIKSALFLWARRLRKSEFDQVQRIFGVPTITRAIHLVTPRLANHPRVTVREGNILMDSGLQGEFHVIRAANILNKGYFNDEALTTMVQNLRRHLTSKGILIVCQTDDQRRLNRASIFDLNQDNRFSIVSRMNGGSEIEDLILQLPAASENPLLAHRSSFAYSAE